MSGNGYGGGNQSPPPQPPYSFSGNNPTYGLSISSPYTVPYGALPPSSLSAPATSGDYKVTKEKPNGGYGAPPLPGPSDYGGYAWPAQSNNNRLTDWVTTL